MDTVQKKIYDFAKESYYWELNRKEQLNSFVSIAIGIVSAQIGAIAYLANNFPMIDNGVVSKVFIAFFALSAVATGLSLYFLFRYQLKYTYAVLSTPQEIHIYLTGLAEHDHNAGVKIADEEYGKELDNTILQQYLSHTTTNFDNNNRKSKYGYRLKLALAVTTIFLILSFLPYSFLDKNDQIQTIRIEDSTEEER